MFKTKNKKGFTLIELLVVIAIIGILSSVVLASLNSARKKSRDARRIADLGQIRLALELYFDASANPKTYPAALSSLAPTYIPALPADPLTAQYSYELCSATKYHIGAALEESTNPALTGNNDAAVSGCTATWGANASACTGTAGTSQGSYCYDLNP